MGIPASELLDQPRPTTTGAQPLFIFSLTRSGSTLLQRILATYDEIAAPTVSEPWILIPQLYALRRKGISTEYTQRTLVNAIEDFAEHLEGGQQDYLNELRDLVMRLYAAAAKGDSPRYFLDKTPSYFFVVEEVMNLFPEAKFVFLWRNPLSVIASLIDWDGGRWDPARYKVVLFDGIVRLVSAWQRHGHRACRVRYEDLVGGRESDWRPLMDYLGIQFDLRSLSSFSAVKLEGRTGDPIGVELYSQLSQEPITKWRREIDNPLRKAWCRRYLRWIGAERLALMGYDLDALLAELDAVPNTFTGMLGDSRRLAASLLKEPVRARMRRGVGLGGSSSFRYLLDPDARGNVRARRSSERSDRPRHRSKALQQRGSH
jgi:hypothetical protein